ncbi:hypothetical protein SKAU_G00166270 [Synaphobranchus kaupii]|uniref:Uncharacterized protein n=1 Tax=Synaphobranchus kaupii TaxID=118154 RepID=A0A9Q1FK06_SYNKA|nr:hypothetical protein SKAU_G00166270 [Synaphobranchus kaupii]
MRELLPSAEILNTRYSEDMPNSQALTARTPPPSRRRRAIGWMTAGTEHSGYVAEFLSFAGLIGACGCFRTLGTSLQAGARSSQAGEGKGRGRDISDVVFPWKKSGEPAGSSSSATEVTSPVTVPSPASLLL